ncbi:MAG: hypothetical protein ABIB55_00220 [Candidatus Nealsonbacteria bacterium]
MNKEFISKLKNICGIFLRSLAANPLYVIVFLFLIVLALGFLVFYQYDILVEGSETKTTVETVKFRKELYTKILKEWQARDERLEMADSQSHINPFNGKQ